MSSSEEAEDYLDDLSVEVVVDHSRHLMVFAVYETKTYVNT